MAVTSASVASADLPPPPPPPPRTAQQLADPDRLDYAKIVPVRFPDEMRGTTIVGNVALRVLVSAEGKPARIEVEMSSGVPAYDEAAVAAVRQWEFKPERRNGKAVEGYAYIPLHFDPRDAEGGDPAH